VKNQSTTFKGRIYAHRGVWGNTHAGNSTESLNVALQEGWSIETDFRVLNGNLIIAHDIDKPNLDFSPGDLFLGKSSIAINIKEDGLQDWLVNFLSNIQNTNSFVFDGSIPEMFRYRNLGLPHALRISEFERDFPWSPDVWWIDAFITDWWLKDSQTLDLIRNRRTVIVSPELHGRARDQVWEFVQNEFHSGNPHISICTDYPQEFLNTL
jgi:hypothetical protein